jgi:DNA-binding XRE family transcriptional regulator
LCPLKLKALDAALGPKRRKGVPAETTDNQVIYNVRLVFYGIFHITQSRPTQSWIFTFGFSRQYRRGMIRRVKTGKDLLAWRTRMTISAQQLAKLIGVAERSIHRAEQTGNLGVKISLAMELLLTRLQHGENDLPSSLEAAPRMGRPPKVKRSLVVEEPGAEYVIEWHGKMSTGADIRRWRRSVGLWQKDLAVLLGVHATTLNRAEGSESPSPGLIYGVELLRKQILQKEFDLDEFRKRRDRTLPRKKEK